MNGTAQQNKSSITLKGSAEIVCEYLGEKNIFSLFVYIGYD